MKKAREGSAEYLKSLSQTRPGVLVLEGAGTMDFPEFRVSGRVLQTSGIKGDHPSWRELITGDILLRGTLTPLLRELAGKSGTVQNNQKDNFNSIHTGTIKKTTLIVRYTREQSKRQLK
ncbi:hypothetical protein RRG08_024866 [Elysia crispata]|uniref:Uncharacterized protein n=1 Tax=Elysia crispata TaxID=231223 RepID=A0AAE0YJC4_9GAST|nr:hypothetical protein RRG08_024866 [Elysia crispata]